MNRPFTFKLAVATIATCLTMGVVAGLMAASDCDGSRSRSNAGLEKALEAQKERYQQLEERYTQLKDDYRRLLFSENKLNADGKKRKMKIISPANSFEENKAALERHRELLKGLTKKKFPFRKQKLTYLDDPEFLEDEASFQKRNKWAEIFSEHGFSPVIKAVEAGELSPDTWLWQPNRNLIDLAISANDIYAVETLIRLGAPVDYEYPYSSRRPIHRAIKTEDTDIVSLVIKHGADLSKIDNNNLTPFMLAVRRGNVDLAKTLVSAGADPNLGSIDQETGKPVNAMDIAASSIRVDVDMIVYLKSLGIPPTEEHIAAAQRRIIQNAGVIDELSGTH